MHPRFAAIQSRLEPHADKLWWLHSLYSLLLGVAMMWLGRVRFAYVRLVVIHIAFIWATSLLLPVILRHPRLAGPWGGRLRLVVNWFNRNFYQQILFFILPLYWASMTPGAANMVFVAALAASAVLSTLDVVYDRQLSVRWYYLSVFFSFNLFASINVLLPISWKIGNTAALTVSALLAGAGYATFVLRLSGLARRQRWVLAGLGTLLLVGLLELGRPLVPPAPLRLQQAVFSLGFRPKTLRSVGPVTELPAGYTGRLYALTAVVAPLGLEEKVSHRWYVDGAEVFASRHYAIAGGRKDGYRLWTSMALKRLPPAAEVRVDVVTQGGQLIGRAAIRSRPAES